MSGRRMRLRVQPNLGSRGSKTGGGDTEAKTEVSEGVSSKYKEAKSPGAYQVPSGVQVSETSLSPRKRQRKASIRLSESSEPKAEHVHQKGPGAKGTVTESSESVTSPRTRRLSARLSEQDHQAKFTSPKAEVKDAKHQATEVEEKKAAAPIRRHKIKPQVQVRAKVAKQEVPDSCVVPESGRSPQEQENSNKGAPNVAQQAPEAEVLKTVRSSSAPDETKASGRRSRIRPAVQVGGRKSRANATESSAQAGNKQVSGEGVQEKVGDIVSTAVVDSAAVQHNVAQVIDGGGDACPVKDSGSGNAADPEQLEKPPPAKQLEINQASNSNKAPTTPVRNVVTESKVSSVLTGVTSPPASSGAGDVVKRGRFSKPRPNIAESTKRKRTYV